MRPLTPEEWAALDALFLAVTERQSVTESQRALARRLRRPMQAAPPCWPSDS